MGTATAGKTGQRERGDHRVGRGKTDPHDQPQPETLSLNGKAKATSKPANADEVTTGFGVESTGLEVEKVENPKRIPSASACAPFREAIELYQYRLVALWRSV
jgi:hypothetical protein